MLTVVWDPSPAGKNQPPNLVHVTLLKNEEHYTAYGERVSLDEGVVGGSRQSDRSVAVVGELPEQS